MSSVVSQSTAQPESRPQVVVAAGTTPRSALEAAGIELTGPSGAVVVRDSAGQLRDLDAPFATADEASAFAQRYPGAFVISGEVPGRGMTYRVRYGNFPTFQDATSAKGSFEKQHGTIALVAAR